jgi:hypothetical protein
VQIILPEIGRFRAAAREMIEGYAGTPLYDLLKAVERVP